MSNKIQTIVKMIVDLLVDGKYQEIENITHGERLSSSDISNVIREYGHTLISPPLSAYDCIDCIRIQGTPFPSWSVVMNLWTRSEGKSDLSIQMTLTGYDEQMSVILEDIHVL